MSGVKHIQVSDDDDGQRLDRWLKKQGMSFTLVQKSIRKGEVRVDGKRAKPDQRLVAGQDIRLPPYADNKETGKRSLSQKDKDFIRSLVIYDQDGIIALNKPQGIATQGGSKVSYHIDGLLSALSDNKGVAPRLVHRLDKETSGVLLLARSANMARELGKLFKGKDIQKIYWAITVPAPEMNEGEICAPIRKAGGPNKENIIVDPEQGQTASTRVEVVERAGKKAAFTAFWPRTGRTHQIRVHAAYMGSPILGDIKYGGEEAYIEGMDIADRVHLHAHTLRFYLPSAKKEIHITADLPLELKKSWKSLGFQTSLDNVVFSNTDIL